MSHDATSRTSTERPERLVPLEEARRRAGNPDRSTITRWAREGKFPPLRRKGDRRLFVLESELLAWMRE